MDSNDNQLSSFFHHHNQQQQQQQQQQHHQQNSTTVTTATASPTNGLLPNTDGSHILYPHSVASSAVSSQLEPAKRKRGRPRKYGTPEQALAAKKASTSSFSPTPPTLDTTTNNKNTHSFSPSSSSFTTKKSHSLSLGNAGQGFSAHVIAVAAGEDVGQKIMQFMQQHRGEICIMSASGSISNASLRQPASSGGNIMYEGRFDIISLTGSYVRNETGGRSGGLSVCLSNSDGQIIGGGVGGPLKAAGPVQVIVGTFFIDNKKDTSAGGKGDPSAGKLPSPVGEPASSLGFRQTVDSSSGNPIRGNDEHQAMGGSHYMIQQLGLHVTPPRTTEWGTHPDSRHAGYDLSGRTGHGSHQSPENGGYDQIPD
ncbi:putative PPC domain-containing protein [Medicago truncatula]|uniref:AT-hook motif nuclear-localized protein n=1 Tax=Medicago truncatula TaxID=3880 RepID=G7L2W9_MEDTR|nr:AT-hook motif nuclear-localized protein 14 isoform X2 [Medicago truncatula]AES82693.1 AT hook motif DNA-binding family protein [Medicago truncatula]RHN49465.1 putative PPC domain-containing protein [Medicago truncatula]